MDMTLTHSRGKMSSVAVRAFLSEYIAEVRGQVAARVLLQQIIQHGGVVCAGWVRHSRISGILCRYTHQVRAYRCSRSRSRCK